MKDVADYLYRKLPCLRSLRENQMIELLEFYDSRGGLAVLRDGKIVAVGLARPLMRDRIADKGEWEWNEFGDTVYIHAAVVEQKNYLPILLGRAINRFGWRKYLALARRGVTRLYDFDKFYFKAKGLCYG